MELHFITAKAISTCDQSSYVNVKLKAIRWNLNRGSRNKKLLFNQEFLVLKDIFNQNVRIKLSYPLTSHWAGFQAMYFIDVN